MNIAHLLISRQFTGAERYATEIASASAARHKVTFIANQGPDSIFDVLRDELDPAVDLVPVRTVRTRRFLRRLCAERQIDIIHCHDGVACRLVRANPWATPSFVSVYRWETPRVSSLHIQYRPRSHRHFEGLIAVGKWQLKDMAGHYYGAKTHVPVFYTPHPKLKADRRASLRGEFTNDENCTLVATIGRLHPVKGHDVLIDAFAQAKLKNTKLVIFGEGEERAALEQQAAQSGADIMFAGHRPNVRDLLQVMDLFVSSARFEPGGMAIAEAMEVGLPIIATRSQAGIEWAEHFPITLVDVDDVSGLTLALKAVELEPVAYDLTPFTADNTARRIEDFYQQVLSR